MAREVICFAGSGGTGKTSLVEAIKARCDSAYGPGKCHIHRSIVRDYYREMGVGSESDFHKLSPEDRMSFQIGLLNKYMQSLEACVNGVSEDIDLIICERSILDHYAYMLYGSRELVRQQEIDEVQKCISHFAGIGPHIIYLPYPAPWHKSGATGDGFRAVEPAKDTIVDAVIYRELSKWRSYLWLGTIEPMPIESRVSKFFQLVFPKRTTAAH